MFGHPSLAYVGLACFEKASLRVQDQPAVAAHDLRLHVPAADRLQHEETHIQDALQGGRSGGSCDFCNTGGTRAAGTSLAGSDLCVLQVKRTLFINGISKYAEETQIKQHFE